METTNNINAITEIIIGTQKRIFSFLRYSKNIFPNTPTERR